MALSISSPPCETFSVSGKGIVVWVDGTCYSSLAPDNGIASNSIPVQLTEGSVQLRDGSASFPIRLPALQKTSGQSVGAIVTQKADGSLQVWDAINIPGKKRLIMNDGAFVLVDDLNSDLFKDLCVGTCEDIEGIIAYKDITLKCPGQADISAIQIFKVPVCYVGQVPDPNL